MFHAGTVFICQYVMFRWRVMGRLGAFYEDVIERKEKVPLLPNPMAWPAETRQRLDDPREWLRGANRPRMQAPLGPICTAFPASLATGDPITSNSLLNSSLGMRRASLFPGSAYVFGVLKCPENLIIKELDHTKTAMTGWRKFKLENWDERRVLRSCSTRTAFQSPGETEDIS